MESMKQEVSDFKYWKFENVEDKIQYSTSLFYEWVLELPEEKYLIFDKFHKKFSKRKDLNVHPDAISAMCYYLSCNFFYEGNADLAIWIIDVFIKSGFDEKKVIQFRSFNNSAVINKNIFNAAGEFTADGN